MTQVPRAADQWSAPIGQVQYRIWPATNGAARGKDCVWRKTTNEAFYGGARIDRVPVGTRLADEWLAHAAGHGRPHDHV